MTTPQMTIAPASTLNKLDLPTFGRPTIVTIALCALFGAFIAAAFYLLLSGAEVATQRSFFMTAVVLIAVMVE